MTASDSDKLTQAANRLWRFRLNLLTSLTPLRLLGYVLVILSVLDIAALLIPPQFLNSGWEFQLFGQLIERIPIPLLGLAFIFIGAKENRPEWEFPLLKLISWLTLVISILYFLMMPLSVRNTLRINRQSAAQAQAQIEQIVTQVDPVRQALKQIQTPEQLAAFLSQQSGRTVSPEQVTQEGQSVAALRDEALKNLDQQEQTAIDQINVARSNQRIEIFKNAIKWNLGALVSAVLLFGIWKVTDWART
jgi:hypothetical protein